MLEVTRRVFVVEAGGDTRHKVVLAAGELASEKGEFARGEGSEGFVGGC